MISGEQGREFPVSLFERTPARNSGLPPTARQNSPTFKLALRANKSWLFILLQLSPIASGGLPHQTLAVNQI